MTPFSHIALTLSGGGFRAAAYSLGVLSYLHELGILKDVKSISSVSGGSFTALKYFQMKADGQTFGQFYDEMYKSLDENKMHIKAIENLNSGKVWKKTEYAHKRRNLINSFALVYDDFLKRKTLGDLMKKKSSLPELICNATDMTHANQFRFKVSNGNRGKFGNGHVAKLDEELIKQVKLGDMLAASSCFPGGFEPISFPNDFFNETVRPLMDEIGLMDGGIINNQGLNQYIIRKKQPDLIIASDVESFNIKEPFKFTDNSTFSKYFKKVANVWTLIILTISTVILFKYNIGFLVWILNYVFSIELIFIILILPWLFGYIASLLLILHLGIFIAFRKAKKASGMPVFVQFSSSRYGNYLNDRANSLYQLALNVFLKNNRRMGYDMAYKSQVGQDYEKVAMVAIYDLEKHNKVIQEIADDDMEKSSQESKWSKMIKLFPQLEPNDGMIGIAKQASEFGTTLWFDEKEKNNVPKDKMINKLITVGRMTTCFVLIKYVLSHELNNKFKREDVPFYNKMTEDWITFKNNPFHGMKLDKDIHSKK